MALNYNKREGDQLHAEEWNELVQEVQGKQSRLNIVDALDSTSSVDVLSAKQGKVLDEKITSANTAISGISEKIDKLPTGIYYGQYDSEEDLEDIQVTTKGYAYIASTDPAVYYIYLYDGNSWINSGNKFVTTNLETDLSTKSEKKAPTTKIVAEGIEAIDVTTEQEFTSTQKETARTNINAQENIGSMADKLPVVAALNNRTADVVQVTGEVRALGYKVLNPALGFSEQVENVVDNDVVIVDNSNTIFEIRDEFNLNNTSVTIPANCTLKFNGGKIKNGSVICSNTNLTGDINLDLVTLSGTIINEELKASYFGIKYSTNADILTYNDAAFECLVTSCENLSGTVGVDITNLSKRIIIDRDISITEPIEITNANLICNKTIRYRGAQDLNGAVITIKGNYKEHIIRLNNDGIAYYGGTYESRKDLPIRGVTVTNFRKGYINFVEVTNFTHNIVFESSTGSDYVAYNTFDFIHVLNGLNALTINVINTGWINNNVFNRGTFNCYTESVFKGHNIAFLIKGNSSHGANQLIFNDNNIEKSHIGIYLDTLAFEDSFINRLRNEDVSDSNLIIENNVSPVQSYYKCKISLYRDNIGQENLYYRRFELVLNSALETKKTYNWELSCLKKGNTFYFKQPVTYYYTPSNVYNFREVYVLTSTVTSKITEESDKFLKFGGLYSTPVFIFNHNGNFIARLTSLLGNTNPSIICVLINKTLNSDGYRTITTSNGFINPNAPLFSESVSYNKWDQVYYEGKYYRFISARPLVVAPEWALNTYYQKNGDIYTLLTSEPSKWSTNYTNYYTKDGEVYYAVTGVPVSGAWDASKVVELTARNNSLGAYYAEYINKGVSGIANTSPVILNGNGAFDINLSGLPTSYYLGVFVGGSLSKFTIDVKSNSTLVSENEPSIISCTGIPDSMIGYFPKNVDGSLVRGYSYWDSAAKKPIYWNNATWVDALGEPAGLQVSDTSVLIDAAQNSSKTINVYSASAITAVSQVIDETSVQYTTGSTADTVESTSYYAGNAISLNEGDIIRIDGTAVILNSSKDAVIAFTSGNSYIASGTETIYLSTTIADTTVVYVKGNWLEASVGTVSGSTYPVTLKALSANSTAPRGAKVIITNTDGEVVIINVVQSY